MPYKDFAIASFWQSSYFKAWTENAGGTISHGYTTPSTSTLYKSVTVSGIPAGATITAYNIYFSRSTGLYGGTGTPASGASVNPSSIAFNWTSSKGGSYPAAGGPGTTKYSDKTGSAEITGCYVRVTYDEAAPTPPPAMESDLSINSAHLNAGYDVIAVISPKASGYWHRFAVWLGAESYTVDTAENSVSFTIPMDWLKQIPNAAYGLGGVWLQTYSGDTQIGVTKYLDLYVYAPATVVPTLTGITAALVSNGVPGTVTRYVQNHSKCLLTITDAQGAYDSTISSYKITGGGFTVDAVSGTVGPFITAGDLTFTALITDSRGRTATATVTIAVDAYNPPSLTAISVFRCDQYGTKDLRGGYVLLKATPVIASIGGQNTAALAGRYYMKGATPGTPEAMVSNTDKILGGGLLLPVKTYIGEIIVQDKLNSYAYTATIPTDIIGLHVLDGVTGAAVGKYAELLGRFESAFPFISPFLYGHENLLHNGDFRWPVNQRGITGAVAATGYFFDRWHYTGPGGNMLVEDGYLLMPAGALIEQRIEGNLLAAKQVTFSIMIGDEVASVTGTMPDATGFASYSIGDIAVVLGYATGYMYVRLSTASSTPMSVQRVKLELGPLSTLADDPPQDYATELLKCLRFFINLGTYAFWNGYATSSTVGVGFLTVPVPMRINPTLSTTAFSLYINGSNFAATITSVTSAASRLDLAFSGAGMPINISGIGTAGAAELLASADL